LISETASAGEAIDARGHLRNGMSRPMGQPPRRSSIRANGRRDGTVVPLASLWERSAIAPRNAKNHGRAGIIRTSLKTPDKYQITIPCSQHLRARRKSVTKFIEASREIGSRGHRFRSLLVSLLVVFALAGAQNGDVGGQVTSSTPALGPYVADFLLAPRPHKTGAGSATAPSTGPGNRSARPQPGRPG
jgi:hypothetical protein